VVDRHTRSWTHHVVGDLPSLLTPGDLLVVNDSRVVPARLLGHRDPSGGQVECLLLRRLDAERWDALMHPGQKMKPGTHARFGEPPFTLIAEVLSQHTFGRRTVRLARQDGGDVDEAIDRVGHMPLPPYIKRPDEPGDRERYQTIYARVRGSVAAPTAGLHLSARLLQALASRGVDRADLTLHVGYGTFKPIRTEQVEEHAIDPEAFEISPEAAEKDLAHAGRLPPRHRGGDDDDAYAGDGGRGARWPGRRVGGRVGAVHLPRFPVPGRRRTADELPPAAGPRSWSWSAPSRAVSSCSTPIGARLRKATGSTATATRC
jgi:S-adenosylmethionine:tRNA ribosyltransferase-isomerase